MSCFSRAMRRTSSPWPGTPCTRILLSTGGVDGSIHHYLLDEQNPPAGVPPSISPYDAADAQNAPAQTIYPAHSIQYAHDFTVWTMDWHPLGPHSGIRFQRPRNPLLDASSPRRHDLTSTTAITLVKQLRRRKAHTTVVQGRRQKAGGRGARSRGRSGRSCRSEDAAEEPPALPLSASRSLAPRPQRCSRRRVECSYLALGGAASHPPLRIQPLRWTTLPCLSPTQPVLLPSPSRAWTPLVIAQLIQSGAYPPSTHSHTTVAHPNTNAQCTAPPPFPASKLCFPAPGHAAYARYAWYVWYAAPASGHAAASAGLPGFPRCCWWSAARVGAACSCWPNAAQQGYGNGGPVGGAGRRTRLRLRVRKTGAVAGSAGCAEDGDESGEVSEG